MDSFCYFKLVRRKKNFILLLIKFNASILKNLSKKHLLFNNTYGGEGWWADGL